MEWYLETFFYSLQMLDAGALETVIQCHADACIRNRINENQVIFGIVEVVHECIEL